MICVTGLEFTALKTKLLTKLLTLNVLLLVVNKTYINQNYI